MKKPEVVVPKTLTWDKLTALYIYVVYVLKQPLSEVGVHFEDEYQNHGSIPGGVYDLDVVQRYNMSGRFGSATERVASNHDLMEEVPGMRHLVSILNRNNRTGCLKGQQQSLVWLIRELYEAGRNVDFRQHRLSVIDLFWPVLDTFFKAAHECEPAVEALSETLTLGGYTKLMHLAKVSDDEITQRLGQLKAGFQKARAAWERSRTKASTVQPEHAFNVSVYRMPDSEADAHMVVSDDTRLPREYLRAHGEVRLLVIRKRSGHYAIFVRGRQILERLHVILEEREPGRWFHDTRPDSPLLLNGSSSRAAVASDLKPLELIRLIQDNYRHRTHRDQQELRRGRTRR
ncbi:hypothetical protein KKG41_02245 [Patescibacteria group bacterium]|nr:hypothetical protein [Patescibacteria group bacterium]MBU1890763.1 hypothetical protein [Patescibacteria group bacterium]